MPKLYSSEEIRKVLKKIGFQMISKKGHMENSEIQMEGLSFFP